MERSKTVVKAALAITIFTLGSKFLGFIREILIATKFGSSLETDTFFIALSASSLIGNFLKSSINTTFIPIISEIESKNGKKSKIEYTNNVINVVAFISLILLILSLLGAPLIVKVLASGFDGDQFELAVELTRIGLPSILFGGIIGVLTGYLQTEGKFNATALIGFPFNFVYIVYLVFLSSKFGIKGLVYTAVFATSTQLLIQIPEVKKIGFKYDFILEFGNEYIRKFLYLSTPVLIGVAINDLNLIIDKTLASSLISGSISALNYANKLNELILGVFIMAITTVIFPLLSKEANTDNIAGLKSTMGYGINLILIITVPAAIGLMVLSTPIIEIAFQRGEFDLTATLMTSQALIFYSIGLVAMALRLLLTRVYYSLQDTKTPMVNGFISVIFNIVLNLILVKYLAHAGLALATSIATTIATIILLYGLKKKIGSLGTKEYILNFLKTGIASSIMGLVAYVTYHGLYKILGISKLYNLISLLVAVVLAVIVYIVLCYIFNITEVRDLINKAREVYKESKYR